MEYRIVKSYDGFFSEWSYRLERKINFWFFGKRIIWKQIAGNALTRYIPKDWKELNIVETITEDIK